MEERFNCTIIRKIKILAIFFLCFFIHLAMNLMSECDYELNNTYHIFVCTDVEFEPNYYGIAIFIFGIVVSLGIIFFSDKKRGIEAFICFNYQSKKLTIKEELNSREHAFMIRYQIVFLILYSILLLYGVVLRTFVFTKMTMEYLESYIDFIVFYLPSIITFSLFFMIHVLLKYMDLIMNELMNNLLEGHEEIENQIYVLVRQNTSVSVAKATYLYLSKKKDNW